MEKQRYRLALIVRQPGSVTMTVLIRPCPPPPQLPELDRTPSKKDFDDVPLWDLPFVELPSACPNTNLELESSCSIANSVHGALCGIGITDLDAASAVCSLKSQLASIWEVMQPWKYWKVVKEPHYGLELGFQTVFFMTELSLTDDLSIGAGTWLNSKDAWKLLSKGPGELMRIGPLATYSFSPHFPEGLQYKLNLTVEAQEYPPGVLLVPLHSSTRKPFSKTNLVVFASSALTHGEALIVDPACYPIQAQEQLSAVVKALPTRLLVFLTHHHVDHIEGLPTVQKQNPEAVILAHELTLQRIKKVVGKLKCISVVDGSMLQIGDHKLQVIAAPGHTDGHLALLHVDTCTLIAGDHCVGRGSSVLDITSGGNMEDYLTTTRKFIDLSPNVIVPMHGPFNLWPRHMMRTYLRHREDREAKILATIEQGARTGFDIVSKVYADTPPELWKVALSNVILHVEHLRYLKKLPEAFSVISFTNSCKFSFMLYWLTYMAKRSITDKCVRTEFIWLVPIAASIGSTWFLWQRLSSSMR